MSRLNGTSGGHLLIKRLYTDNISGKVNDKRSSKFETEQAELNIVHEFYYYNAARH